MQDSFTNTFTDLLSSMPTTDPSKSSGVAFRSTRFHVPDDDESDSSSESSREASVEIVNTQVRAYSVPSSEGSVSNSDDEEGFFILKEVPLSQPKTNAGIATAQSAHAAGTTPHHALEVETEPPSSKEPELSRPCETTSFISSSIEMDGSGSSRLYPTADVELSSDSEDERPEVLSSRKTQVRSAPHVFVSSSTQAANSPYLPGDSPLVGREARNAAVDRGTSKNHENSERGMVEPSFTNSHLQVDDSPLNRPANESLREVESTDADQMDCRSLFHPFSVHNVSTLAGYNLNSIGCSTSSPAPAVFYFPPSKSIAENLQITSMIEKDCSSLTANCKATIENNEKNSAHEASLPRRPPSPSDAALVKKAKFADQRSLWSAMGPSQSQSPMEGCRTLSNETRGMREADSPYPDFTKEGPYNCGFDSSAWTCTYAQPVDCSQVHGSAAEPAPPSLSETASSRPAVQGHPLEPTLFPSCNLPSYIQGYTPLIPNDNQDPSICGVHHPYRKENGNHPSRLNISDIVHPQLESTRNLKRKADEISVDDAEAVFHALPSESSQEVLTDAQPRDITSTNETILLEDSSNIPIQGEISIQRLSISDSPESPRKKVKTSVSTAIGVGKFVSGVCFGVVGAFAAFIATIPLSVREEAMQELVSSI